MELEVGSACDKGGQGAKDPLLLWSRKNGRTEEPVLSIFPPFLLLPFRQGLAELLKLGVQAGYASLCDLRFQLCSSVGPPPFVRL